MTREVSGDLYARSKDIHVWPEVSEMVYVEVEDRGDWWDVRVGRRGRLNSLLWQGAERKDRIGHTAQGAIGWALANLEPMLMDADGPQFQPSQVDNGGT